MIIRFFLTRQTSRLRYLIRYIRSLGIATLMVVTMFFNSFGETTAHRMPVMVSDRVTRFTESKDTVRPRSTSLPVEVSNEDFQKKALAKIKEFQGCLIILCDARSGNEEMDNAVDQAASLFVDGAIIEVSSVNSREKKHLKVRDFLEKLRNLPYDGVVITFTHVDYVSHIRKGPDGNYYGLVSFEQTFRAYRDGRLVYEDETKKTAEVRLVVYERSLHGNAVQQWDVMLSDVEVLGTKTPKR